MVRPNLLNAILVEIRQLDKDSIVYDPRKKEESNVLVWFPPFKIKAQIYFGKEQYWSSATAVPDPRSLGGVLAVAEGYIVVSKYDLMMLGKELKDGDMIISYGHDNAETACDLIIVGHKSAAHYSDIGRCGLEKWWFKDKDAG